MNTVKCRYYAFKYSKILHKWLQQFRQNINDMLDPQKTPMGRLLWTFFRKPRYNSTTLYFHIPLPLTLESHGPLNRQFNWNSLSEWSWNPPGLEQPSPNCGQLWNYPNDKRNQHSGPQVLFVSETGLKHPGAIIVYSLITVESDLETHHHGDYSTAIPSQQ